MKGFTPTDRLIELAPGGMCQYQVRLTNAAEVDAELVDWIKAAFDKSGE